MFEFVCDHLVPGCTHKDHDERQEQLSDRAVSHLKEHHNLDYHDEPMDQVLKRTGIQFIRPA